MVTNVSCYKTSFQSQFKKHKLTSGRVLDGELLYTTILEVNLFAFAYRLFHEAFSPNHGALHNTQPLELGLPIQTPYQIKLEKG